MLDRGEIDALISADVSHCVLQGSPRVGTSIRFNDLMGKRPKYLARLRTAT